MKRSFITSLALGFVFAVNAANVAQALFPYTIVGRAVGAGNLAFDADSQVTLKAMSTNGTVLAQAKVYTPTEASPWNFRLAVPVASSPTAGYAVKGETLVLTALFNGTTYTGLLKGDDARIGEPGASVELRIMLADDANGNGIDDDYDAAIESEMPGYGLSGAFDPEADYDKDGLSNRSEYLLGTDPFDASDAFGVDELDPDADDNRYFKVTFWANGGRAYTLRESADPAAPAASWTRGSFKTDPASEVQTLRLVSSRGAGEEKTVYLLKQGEKRFYKLELEQ